MIFGVVEICAMIVCSCSALNFFGEAIFDKKCNIWAFNAMVWTFLYVIK